MRLTPAHVLCALLLACAAETQPLGEAASPARVGAAMDSLAARGDLTAPRAPADASAATPPAGFENDPRWHAVLLKIAGRYETWGRVDDRSRWAPYDCRMPPPPQARFSASGDPATHGGKLYTLYALDAAAYGAPASVLSDDRATFPELTQSVVKEAFVPEHVPAPGSADEADEHLLRPATREGKTYRTGARQGLFIMARLARDEPGTDRGWIYGTVASDRRTITASGHLSQCIRCHESAPKDRLFGVPAPSAQ